MPSISKTFITSLLGSLIVAGCGGGGSSVGSASASGSGSGSGSGMGSSTTFPLSTALANLYATGFQKTLNVTGTARSRSNHSSSEFTGPLTVAQGPANAGATFQDQPARQIAISLAGTFNISNTDGGFASATNHFLSASNQLMGTSSKVSHCVASTPGQYPDTVSVGQAQLVATYACSDVSSGTAIGEEKISFIVTAASSPGAAMFSSIETFSDSNANLVQYIQKDYLIDTSGNISLQSLKFTGALTSTGGAATPGDLQLSFKSQ